LLVICYDVVASSSKVQISENKWDKMWRNGDWSYQDTVPIERIRSAIIGGVYIPFLAHVADSSTSASILEIGCGEGVVSDYLTNDQKKLYTGVDISKEAIAIAETERPSPMQFIHSSATEFRPNGTYDVIIFSEVLYYTNHEGIIDQYLPSVNPNGTVIISIFHMEGGPSYDHIFSYAKKKMQLVDEVYVAGQTKKKSGRLQKTSFKIKAYRKQ
jgi:2-polyprenyl-6-hydroxyphenyl methylase/3-demethylubiquinone-9 3-methyltransferase